MADGNPEEDADEAYSDRLNQMRDVARTLAGLQATLQDVMAGTTTLDRRAKYVAQCAARVTEALDGLRPVRDAEIEAVTIARDRWTFMRESPVVAAPEKPLSDATVLIQEAQRVSAAIDAVTLALGRVTIPPRLNDWLGGTVPSYYLPFHAIFADELPRQEDRQAILNDLAWNPDSLPHGLVSPGAGLVYRHSGSRVKSWLVVALLALVFLLVGSILLRGALPVLALPGVGVLWSGDLSLLLPEPAGGRLAGYLVPWIALLTGIVVHALVDAQKRSAQEGRPPLFSLTLFPLWMDALAGVFMFKLLLSLIALGAFFAFPGISLNAGTAFLAGYSLDSVVGLFGETVDRRAARQFATWKKSLEDE